jgi:hypothetical protein
VVDGQLREIDVPDEETEMVASAITRNPIIQNYSDLEKFFDATDIL